MVRRKRYFEAGHYYHLYNRGNNRGDIFFAERDYAFFLRRVRRYVLDVAEVVAYCLMPSHYHILMKVRSVDDGLVGGTPVERERASPEVDVHERVSGALRRLSISYTRVVNAEHRRVGALFQGHYRFKHVDDCGYLQYVSRYIHRNPVEAGLVASCAEWMWSSYPEYIELREGTLPQPGVIMEAFSSSEEYREFVEHPLSDEPEAWRSVLITP